MASLCIVTMTTAGKSFPQRALAFVFVPVLALWKNFQLSSSATLSAVFWVCPDGTFRPPRGEHGGVSGCTEPAALLAAVVKDTPC